MVHSLNCYYVVIKYDVKNHDAPTNIIETKTIIIYWLIWWNRCLIAITIQITRKNNIKGISYLNR